MRTKRIWTLAPLSLLLWCIASAVFVSGAGARNTDTTPHVAIIEHATRADIAARAEVATWSATSSPCASCHASIAREWEASNHRRSASDPAYQTAVEHEPLSFCRGCHAPRADVTLPTPAPLREQGIGCIDCHMGFTSDHASRDKERAGRAPAKECASCHDFAFPSGIGHMQMTADEHKASAFADTRCDGCHMKETADDVHSQKPHKDHRFNVTPLLEDAIAVDVARASDTRVAVRLRPNTIGHAFPTGDLFRRVRVRAEVAGDDSAFAAERYLSRHFTSQKMANGHHARVDDRDDRVGMRDQPACFELDVGMRGRGHAIDVEIALDHVDAPGSSDAKAKVSAHIIVWKNSLESTTTNAINAMRPCPR